VYSDFGRAVVDRVIDLGKEVSQLRASVRTSREEVRDAHAGRDDAERRARTLAERIKELETRAEMAESNLRTLLASARGQKRPDATIGDSEMEAILGVLKGDGDGTVETAEATGGEAAG
jgi:chromosome segregation ATPase